MFLNKYFFGAFLTCLVFAGCAQSSPAYLPNANDNDSQTQNTETQSGTVITLDGKSFTLQTFNGKTLVAPATLVFETGKLNARICNTMNGAYTLEAGILKSERVISTKMACVDEFTSTAENAFLKLLSTGAVIAETENYLSLSSEEHSFIFAIAADGARNIKNDLTGTYQLQSFNEKAFNQNAYTLKLTEKEISAKLCNHLGGSYTLMSEEEGSKISSELSSTLMFCEDANIMDAENAFNSLLREGAQIGQKEDILTISGKAGTLEYKKI